MLEAIAERPVSPSPVDWLDATALPTAPLLPPAMPDHDAADQFGLSGPARTPRIDDQTHSPDQFSMIRRFIRDILCWINEFREPHQDYPKYCSYAEDPPESETTHVSMR
jgi:hypothetical protein